MYCSSLMRTGISLPLSSIDLSFVQGLLNVWWIRNHILHFSRRGGYISNYRDIVGCLLDKDANEKLWESWGKKNELLFILVSGKSSWRDSVCQLLDIGSCTIWKAKVWSCGPYLLLTSSNLYVLFRFLFIEDDLSTYLFLKRVKSVNYIVRVSMFSVNYFCCCILVTKVIVSWFKKIYQIIHKNIRYSIRAPTPQTSQSDSFKVTSLVCFIFF